MERQGEKDEMMIYFLHVWQGMEKKIKKISQNFPSFKSPETTAQSRNQ